jgi:hypothetical protein
VVAHFYVVLVGMKTNTIKEFSTQTRAREQIMSPKEKAYMEIQLYSKR